MPITIRAVEGLLCPVVVCDWCGERIQWAEGGNVYWFDDAPSGLVYNNKHCAWDHEAALSAQGRGGVLLSEHLEVFLAQLLGNTGKLEAMRLVDEARLYATRGEKGGETPAKHRG